MVVSSPVDTRRSFGLVQNSDLKEQIRLLTTQNAALTQQITDLETGVQRRDSVLLVEREDLKNAQVWAVAA